MTKPVVTLTALFTVTLGLMLAGMPATAQTTTPRTTVQPERLLTLRDIVQHVLPLFPGQLLKSVQTRDTDGRPVYRLLIIDEGGHLLVVTADAQTARILSARSGGL